MKVLIVTCFESNEERASYVYDACLLKGFDVKIVTTNYSHIKKQYRTNLPDNYIGLDTKPYNKNLSIDRILSHIKFGKDAFDLIEKEDPDLIWLMAPANSLIKQARLYKQKYKDKKLIIDIIDMWPESLPININKDLPPFSIWKAIRSNNINCADYLASECDLYKGILRKEYKKQIKTIRWCRDTKINISSNKINNDKFSLVYIGSINNIISVENIANVIKTIEIPVDLHVIGEGENKDNFIETLNRYCNVIYHGPIREEKEKSKIFDLCHAGINIYRDNLYIGLTVKCIDYLGHGLPIINNIKGDTWSLVNKYDIGINIDKDTKLDVKKLIEIRNNNNIIYDVYKNNFSKEIFTKNCMEVIDEVLK